MRLLGSLVSRRLPGARMSLVTRPASVVGRGRAPWRPLGRRRARLAFLGDVLAAFGCVSAIVQFVGQLFPAAFPAPGPVTVVSVGLCLLWGLARARPKAGVRQEFTRPGMAVVVEEGDLFDASAHLVVGFCDTFDTVVDDGVVINDASVQGQLLTRRYAGELRRLDEELSAALSGTAPVRRETAERKPLGKLDRYPIGTVAVLGARPRLVFAVAYSRIGNDYVASTSVEDLWYSLNRLWDAVHRYGQLECVALPLIGAGLSRLDSLDEESLLRLILLSFVTRSCERVICRELRVVIRPEDIGKINLSEVEAFLATLAAGARRQV